MKKIVLILLVIVLLVVLLIRAGGDKAVVIEPDNQDIEVVEQKAELPDIIVVENPKVNQSISSPVEISGQARGLWFFEANFPIVVVDWDGLIIGEGYATAQSDWMTEEFVPFTATVEFDVSKISGNYSNRGSLILQKSNPSGLPEHADALEFPILFNL